MRSQSGLFQYLRLIGIILLALLIARPLAAQTPDRPEDCQSPWGAEDQRGAANRLTSAKTLEAVALIKQGKIYQLGRPYEMAMPVYGSRRYVFTLPQMRGPLGNNKLTWNEEFVAAQLGQVGTQFDGLGHIGINGRFFNCNEARDFVRAEGLTRLGVENVGSFFTRGVLIDMAGFKGVASLEKGYEITVDDLKGALAKEGISPPQAGDAVILHTGWGSHWITDNALYNSGEPGIGLPAGRWLVEQKIVLVGADTAGVEVQPYPGRPGDEAVVHQLLLTQNGTYILENLDTSELARDKVYEFAFIFSPLKLKGATGSPGNPIAVR